MVDGLDDQAHKHKELSSNVLKIESDRSFS